MRKSISLILSLALLFCSLPVFAFAEAEPELKIAVASDIHYNLPEESLVWKTDDPVFGYANRRAAMENESGFILDSFLDSCKERKVDFVLISGDLADNGRTVPEEHYAVRDKLLNFEKETGIDVFVIDGNHDLGNNSLTGIAEFKEIYKDLGYDLALEKREDDCSYTADLGEKYRLIALDSCDPSVSTEDGMTSEKVRWVLDQAKAAVSDGKHPVLMMHHNLLDHLPAQRILSHNFIIRNHTATAELFANAGIKIVLTGHEHCSDAAVYTSALGNKIFDFATTSLTMYPLAYRELEFSDSEINYKSINIEKIDVAALSAAVSGYTDTQLELMNKDLTAFSRQYLKKGIEYRLSLQLSAEKSGIEENSVFYPLVDSAYSHLGGLLSMPLYGENSVSEIAAKYNIEIPETNAENGWDLATDFVAAHFEGEESFDINGPEISALLRTASLILRYVPGGISDDIFNGAANAIIDSIMPGDLKELCRSAFGSVTPAEYFIAALVSGLVCGFTSDSDGVPDNNGTLEGYGKTDRAQNITDKIDSLFNKIFNLIKTFFAILLKPFMSAK
ncbi:MAG: metallophosphoesterase [Oscillospiraceae bacterium]|nr:metallophosphoesterase [Oscillospiraceae bacterium]